MIFTPRNAAIPMIARAMRKPAFPSPLSDARWITTASPSPGASRLDPAEMQYRFRVRVGQPALLIAVILAIGPARAASAGVLERGIEEDVPLAAGTPLLVENLL